MPAWSASVTSTAERIARNERGPFAATAGDGPAQQIDNDMLNDVIDVSAPADLGAARTCVYRARRRCARGRGLSPVVTQGYSGSIQLIVAIRYDGSLAGVRALTHHETPGLGDKIEIERTDWIRSLTESRSRPGAVGMEGEATVAFDQFTGATITRARRGTRGKGETWTLCRTQSPAVRVRSGRDGKRNG